MAKSKIDICNIALGMIGESSIRTFEEDNSRARLCDNQFDVCRDYLMSFMDWTFARGLALLGRVTDPDVTKHLPEGYCAYQVPTDCLVPRDLHPRGTDVAWELMGDNIVTLKTEPVHLYYTRLETDTAKFNALFINSVAELLASRLANPLKQDKQLARALFEVFGINLQNTTAVDANIGSEYRHSDERPEKDSFVTPDGWLDLDITPAR